MTLVAASAAVKVIATRGVFPNKGVCTHASEEAVHPRPVVQIVVSPPRLEHVVPTVPF